MKYIKVIPIILLLFSSSLTEVNAQNILIIKENTEAHTQFTFDSIRKLTFSTGSMTIDETNGNSSTYLLGSIRYLNFFDHITNVSQITRIENSKIIFYPNPVIDQLQIQFESTKAEIAYLKILNVQGKVFHQQPISCVNGINHKKISVAQLPNGLYVCHLQTGDKFESIRFLKN